MWKSFYNPDLGKVETPQGTMTLPKIFLPLFLEMFLMNLMSTVNTFTLSFYSDEAVAAVGSAGQFMGMILNFYSVISTGASIVISQNLGAKKEKKCIRCCFLCAVCRCRVKRSPWCYTFVLFHAPDAADEFIRPGINICLFLPENLHSCFLFCRVRVHLQCHI